jgi:GlpG protein
MINVFSVNEATDLGDFSRLLWQRKISHRIMRENGEQFVLVADRDRVHETFSLFNQWQAGQVRPAEQDSSGLDGYFRGDSLLRQLLHAFRRAPLTLVLIAVCIVLSFLAPLDAPTELTRNLMFPDFSFGTRMIILSRVVENFSIIQLFRMMSPMLLHAGLLHLLFNMTWLWELGQRIELRLSSAALGVTIIVLSLVSNTIQYLYGGGSNFGGMSGVVYGLFSYIWMWQLVMPARWLNLPGSLIIFMLASLLIFTLLDLGMIANAAHMGGFIAGIVYGAMTAGICRWRTVSRPSGKSG